jgi:hypothetical protein
MQVFGEKSTLGCPDRSEESSQPRCEQIEAIALFICAAGDAKFGLLPVNANLHNLYSTAAIT